MQVTCGFTQRSVSSQRHPTKRPTVTRRSTGTRSGSRLLDTSCSAFCWSSLAPSCAAPSAAPLASDPAPNKRVHSLRCRVARTHAALRRLASCKSALCDVTRYAAAFCGVLRHRVSGAAPHSTATQRIRCERTLTTLLQCPATCDIRLNDDINTLMHKVDKM